MRITNNVISEGFLFNVNRNLRELSKYNEQLTTGKEVLRPSDDPITVGKIMHIDNNILQNEQYNTNITESLGWVRTQDKALGDATQSMQRIRDLIVYGATDTLADSDREAVRNQIEQEIEHLSDVFNTSFDGRYVFSGMKTRTKPFELNGTSLEYKVGQGENAGKNISREISDGVMVELITDGARLMESDDAGEKNLGKFLNSVITAFDDDNPAQALTSKLNDMDHHLNNVVKVRTQIGAIENRLEAAEARNKSENTNLKEILSEKEDADMVEKFIQVTTMSNIYKASLSVGARLLEPSVLDYLR